MSIGVHILHAFLIKIAVSNHTCCEKIIGYGIGNSTVYFTRHIHGEVFCYLSTPWGEYEKVPIAFNGQVIEICARQGAMVNKGDVIAYVERSDIFA